MNPSTGSSGSKSSLLYQRLEEALQHGSEVEVVVANGSFCGIPANLDEGFLELVNFYVPESRTSKRDQAYERTVWLIKISEIMAVAYSTESWSKYQFEQLLDLCDPEGSDPNVSELDISTGDVSKGISESED
ncbi:MAG: hypothetical protein ACRC8A_03090 [Microcoleaceae cyanobacterium]